MRLTPCYRHRIEGVLFVLLYVLLFILYDISLPRLLSLLHHESCATRQHTTLSYNIGNLRKEDDIVVLLVIVLVETTKEIRDSRHLQDEFEDIDRRLLQRLC